MDIVAAIGSALPTIGLGIVGLFLTSAILWVTQFLRSKINSETLDILAKIADAAVKAAEQDPRVTDKKQSALNAASALLNDLGIKVSPEALDAAIENAVMEAFNYDYENGSVKAGFVKKPNPNTVVEDFPF